ncbi:MAG: TSUP family transporter [Polyangiaceae bacterium]|nr:TSUP family transporter [Polyangiaceae bacterium]NUQ74527.1 TSUP family transporter [Polyangiaceae bacterium]
MHSAAILSLPLLGLLAGALTTVAGLGGGMLLILVLSILIGPAPALACTAPALLLGNIHRFSMLRDKVDARIALAFVAGALPGSILGGLLAARLPEAALHAIMAIMVVLAVLRAFGYLQIQWKADWMMPAGLGIGALAATSGGAGLLLGPLLMAAGLKGEAYIATGAVAAASMHIGRLVAYGASGLVTREVALIAGVLAASILAGNFTGLKVRRRLAQQTSDRVELGALVGCAALAIVGVGH